jgi:hypothetical protein
MVISAWLLEIAWIVGADFACQMKISCDIDRDLFVTSFLGVENCSPANIVVALVDFTQGVSFTLKHLRWFLKQMCDSLTWTCSQTCKWCVLHERILAWMKACELRIALVKNCGKMFVYFSFDDLFLHLLWWNLCFAAKICFVGILAVLLYSLSFVELEELVTDDQSLLRISISLRVSVASLRVA